MDLSRPFPTHLIHGPEQMLMFRNLIENGPCSKKDLLFLAAEIASHGLFDFGFVENEVRAIDKTKIVSQFLDRKRLLWESIRSMPTFRSLVEEKSAFAALYSREEPYFEKGTTCPDRLVIVFCSIFNNLFVSNVSFAAVLRSIGCSMLFIKDPSRLFFLKGASGFGDSFDRMTGALQQFIRQGDYSKVGLIGYSSSGYGALRTALALQQVDTFIGFSIRTNMTDDAEESTGRYFERVRQYVPAEETFSLKERFWPHERLRTYLVYGADNEIDLRHAQNLMGLNEVKLIEIDGCDHDTPAHLISQNRLASSLQIMLG
jgi:hypothetical protein